jgi:hypothetical protein
MQTAQMLAPLSAASGVFLRAFLTHSNNKVPRILVAIVMSLKPFAGLATHGGRRPVV